MPKAKRQAPQRVTVTAGPFRGLSGVIVQTNRGLAGNRWKIDLVDVDGMGQHWIEHANFERQQRG